MAAGPPARGAFRSLSVHNYRLWTAGALVSNVGAWMQRIAQDWLVLTQLTHNNATAMGVVMGLQFAPQVLLLPLTGFAADHLDRRKLILATQTLMGLLALALGLLTVTGQVRLWEVYLFAGLLGCVTAFDAPARQTFVADLVGEAHLSNAVALNSTSFNLARMVGPALAGGAIAAVGTGWLFLINAASFVAVIASLGLMRGHELQVGERALRGHGSLARGFAYIWARPDLKALMLMFFLIGVFGLNYPIYISTMSVRVFHVGSGGFGLLTTAMAVGSVAGAFLSARRDKPRITLLLVAGLVFGVGFTAAALAPSYAAFAVCLALIGVANQTLTTTTTATVQLSTAPTIRGRVMAILLAVALGGTPLGAPLVGWIADRFGPRWAVAVGALAGFGAALVAARYLTKHRGLRIAFADGRPRLILDKPLANLPDER